MRISDWSSDVCSSDLEGEAEARSVLVATGVRNRRPSMDEALHDKALADGLIRYCPICDGYELTDRKVGVIGSDSHGVAEDLFLLGHTAAVTHTAPATAMPLTHQEVEKLAHSATPPTPGPPRAAG